ncbi:uncharacterized protein LOC130591895 [Beta vulgaris subsp. vulgaris]|uniref:uncharacterized protein LOC130591895 n=1 Tax=Beta vulgaris subsp. vulgaris TaxID=3555 RepID=UPI002548A20C|nr:uncharacterized protein LOC130591895 [Beta vulgaris subsp. vulgaris]
MAHINVTNEIQQNVENNEPQEQLENSQAEQIRQLREMNTRLLAILEKQEQNRDNEEGKFYKRLAAHKPRGYDGEADPVKFEDWIAYMEKLLDVYQKRIGVYNSFEDLYDRALEHERIEQKDENSKRKKKGNEKSGAESSKKIKTDPAGTSMALVPAKIGGGGKKEWKCRRCGKDHYGKNCEGQSICFKCMKTGHRIKECPVLNQSGNAKGNQRPGEVLLLKAAGESSSGRNQKEYRKRLGEHLPLSLSHLRSQRL